MNTLKLWQLDSVLLSSNSSGQLHISDHDGDSLSVNSAQVGVLEEAYQISLCGLLKGQNCLGLESDVTLDFSSQVLDDSLEWQLSDEEFGLSK